MRVRGNGMFDWKKFVEVYAADGEARLYVAWFSYPDARGVWCPFCTGPITLEGAIQLMHHDAEGDISGIEIRHW